jgi:hypothetical protein
MGTRPVIASRRIGLETTTQPTIVWPTRASDRDACNGGKAMLDVARRL